MKTKLIIKIFQYLIILGCSKAYSQTTIIGGSISGTWTKSGSPYNITGHIQIDSNSTLLIEPGVIINFQGQYKIKVQGRLLAMGKNNDLIVFTAANTTTGWKGIRFEEVQSTNDSSKIIFCKIEYVNIFSLPSTEWMGSIYIDRFSKFKISNCIISNNRVRDGGGIYIENVTGGIITNNKIINCTASSVSGFAGSGGGIYAENNSNSDLIISHNFISNNYAAGSGGGILILIPSVFNRIMSINNNVIVNNTSNGGNGGGGCRFESPFASSSTLPIGIEFINNTIANNLASLGGGMSFSSFPKLYARNNIIYGNVATNSGNQISISSENNDPNFINCNIQGGQSEFYIGSGTFTGLYNNNININPQFISPSTGVGKNFDGTLANWKLANTSACIDVGNMNIIHEQYDIEGQYRITPCIVDLGAYENQYYPPFSLLKIDTSQGNTTCIGDSLKLEINDTIGLNSYQWRRNGINIVGANNSKYFVKKDGSYSLAVIGKSNCTKILDSVLLYFTPNAQLVPESDSIFCIGNSVKLNANTYNSLRYQWKLNGIIIPGAVDSTYIASTPGIYSVQTNRLGKCFSESNTISISHFPELEVSINPTDSIKCVRDTIYLTTKKYLNVVYSWFLNDSIITTESSNILKATKKGEYNVVVTDSNQCVTNSNKAKIDFFNGPYNDEKICAVSVDSINGFNKINWSTTSNKRIKSYNIYRESQATGEFELIKTLPYGTTNWFVDSNSITSSRSYIYRISIVDSCELISNLSPIHKTLFLMATTNGNTTNLSWTNYEGIQYTSMEMQRSHNNSPFKTIAIISKNNQAYTDIENLSGIKKYRLRIKNENCNQIQNPFILSNLVNASTTSIENISNNHISIYPNPFTESIQINGLDKNLYYNVKINEVTGKNIYNSTISGDLKINMRNYDSGIYILKINDMVYRIIKL